QHKNQISMVLMDIMMPDMDGLTAIGILQKMNPHLKIIGISGIAMNKELVKAAGAGVNKFLQKPYTLNELLQIIKNILSDPDID
ncbi:response regulator, partial [Halotia wernerae UHCC 0503]|nr:response regulator [Halotia wernerae UHCC 0503]